MRCLRLCGAYDRRSQNDTTRSQIHRTIERDSLEGGASGRWSIMSYRPVHVRGKWEGTLKVRKPMEKSSIGTPWSRPSTPWRLPRWKRKKNTLEQEQELHWPDKRIGAL